MAGVRPRRCGCVGAAAAAAERGDQHERDEHGRAAERDPGSPHLALEAAGPVGALVVRRHARQHRRVQAPRLGVRHLDGPRCHRSHHAQLAGVSVADSTVD